MPDSSWQRIQETKAFLAARFAEQTVNPLLTVGVEHEFFLNGPEGQPATHELSQKFLLAFAADTGSEPTLHSAPVLGTFVGEVRYGGSPSDCVLKYEHHPHLMELAVGPFSQLQDLSFEIGRAFGALERAAAAAGLSVCHTPFLDSSVGVDEAVWSPHPLCRALREYRLELATQRGETWDRATTNFSAYVAATQIHVGGVSWGDLNACVDRLYAVEHGVAPLAYLSARQPLTAFKRRWAGYLATVGEFPLVGVPRFEEWSVDWWLQALTRMPSAAMPALEEAPPESAERFLGSRRDFQAIRPRTFGTLEFRADPGQPDHDALLALAALRLGATVRSAEGWSISERPECLRSAWLQTGDLLSLGRASREILEGALGGLKRRGHGEEEYLVPLSTALAACCRPGT